MQRFSQLALVLAIASGLSLLADDVEARNLFEVFAETTDHDPGEEPEVAVQAGGSSMIDLVEDVIRGSADFQDFSPDDVEAFAASLTYAGVSDAIKLDFFTDEQTGEQVVDLELITGFKREFRGSSRDDLEDQIVDFLKEDGAKEYAKFQREIEKRSLVAVLDGNPSSTTALLSGHTFRRFGLGQIGPIWFDRPALGWTERDGRRFWLSVNPSYQRIDADRLSGQQFALELSSGVWFTEHVGLSTASVFAYREIEDAESVQGGLDLGVPIRFRPRAPVFGEAFNLGWQLTPFVSGGGAGSIDMVAGGLVVGGGLSNQLNFGFEHFDIVAASQLAYYEGLRVRVSDYEFRPDLSQWVLTNGLKAHVPLNPGENFIFEGGASYTRYLEDAAVQSWFSPTAGIILRTPGGHNVKLNYTADIGEESYRSHNLHLGLNLQF